MLVDPQLQRLVEPDLDTGERLLWVGRPDSKRMALQTIGSFVFGIAWTAFAIHFIWNWLKPFPGQPFNFRYDWDLPMLIFMVPFVGLGFAMLLAPLSTYLKALRTVYAITDRRILIIVAGASRSIQSYSERDMGHIVRVERANGTGDLFFAQGTSEGKGDGKFVGIPEARSVEALLEDVLKRR